MDKNINYQAYKHYNGDLEDAILGACLLENDALFRVRNFLEPIHFFFKINQVIYKTLCEMWNNGEQIDLITVTHSLYKEKLDKEFNEYGNAASYMSGVMANVVSTGHLESHAVILRELFAERECVRIQADADNTGGDAIAKMQDMQEQIQQALTLQTTDDWKDMSQVMYEVSKHMENVKGKDLLGLPSGYPTLDKLTYGFQPGDLIIIGARPSVGKSAFVGSMAVNVAKKGHKVGIISLEMPEKQIGSRMASFYSDVEFWRIYRNKFESDEQEMYVAKALSEMALLPISISDTTNVGASDIRGKAYNLNKRGKLDMLMIDYLQLVETESGKNDTREREVAKLSRALKLLGMSLKIPVIVLCQLNRKSDERTNKKPRMSDLRESGALEQDADLVMILHRDWKSGILTDENGESTEFKATCIIEKNRNGECREVDLCFDPDKMKFYEKDEFDNSLRLPTKMPTETQQKITNRIIGEKDLPF